VYTFDPSLRLLTSSHGGSVEFDHDMAAEVAAGFSTVVATDIMASDVLANIRPGPVGCGNDGQGGYIPCDEIRNADAPARPGRRLPLVRRASRSGHAPPDRAPSDRKGRLGREKSLSSTKPAGRGWSTVAVTPLPQTYFTCTDMATNLVGYAIQANDQRSAWIRRIVADGVTGIVTRSTVSGLRLAGDVAAVISGGLAIRITLAYFNAANCPRDGSVRTHPITIAGPYYGGLPTLFTKVCRDEEWEISYDGGFTWIRFTVEVCQWTWI
jgi:hypothetical protein